MADPDIDKKIFFLIFLRVLQKWKTVDLEKN